MSSSPALERSTAARPVVMRPALIAVLALYLGACSEPTPPQQEEVVASTNAPLWVNGDFESSPLGASPSGWTITNHQNFGIVDLRPTTQSFASLNLQAGGTLNSVVIGGAAESQADPNLGTGASFRYPRFGVRAGVVNFNPSGAIGNNYNANVMRQTMTAALGDIDPTDGEVHVRFVIAPVLENPGHAYNEQPYYYVELRNLTRNTTLYQDFNTSAQSGVPWKLSNGIYYTDWQLVDISPGNAALAVGDQVELIVVAAGCSQSGHWGRVYVDGVAASVPGIYTWASGAQLVTANSNLTYTVNYRNGGQSASNATTLAFNTPPNTTFQSVSLGSPTCTAPAVNAAGVVTCSLGTLAPGATGSLTVTVRVNSGTAAGTLITAGNYSISATGISPLLGPKVNTSVVASGTFADVGVTKTDNAAAREWGAATSYTIVVSNSGPSAAPSVTVADTMPAQLAGVTWSCVGAGGATCTASGSGNINDTASVPVGATATYTVNANLIAGSGAGSVSNTVTATVGGGATDADTSNNAAADTTALGTLRTLTVNKIGALGGAITSTPAAISCGTSCSSANASFLDGSTVILNASAVPNASFVSWGGACAAAGSANTCMLTIAGDTNVTATFIPPPAISATGGAMQSTAVGTAFGSALTATVADGNGTPISGATVTFTVVPVGGASATLSSSTATTNASGLASVTATANTTLGSYTVTANVAGAPSPATFSLSNVVGPPAQFDIVSGTPQSRLVGTAFTTALSVRVRDALGNPIPGQTVAFGVPGSGASAVLSSTTATTNASGIATITATANTVAGAYTVSASSGVLAPLSFALTNTPGAASSIALTSGTPQSTTVGTAFPSPLALTVTDAFGNLLSGVGVMLTGPGSGAAAALSLSSGTTNAAGQISVTATANTIAGTYNVTASVAGIGTPSTFSLTNLAGAPSVFAMMSGDEQTTTVNTAFVDALSTRLTDAFGNPIVGATVGFSAPGSGATAVLGAASAVTNASGVATMSATAGTVSGAYVVTASTGTLPPLVFALGNDVDVAAAITVDGGDAQMGVVTETFDDELALTVTDQFGNPRAGATVTFTVPSSGATATLSTLTAVTDAEGRVSIVATAGSIAGAYSVTASVDGVVEPAAFALVNLSSAPSGISVRGGDEQSTIVDTGFAEPLAVLVTGVRGDPLANVIVTFTIPTAGATAILSTLTATTDASGVASVDAVANTVSGTYEVTASLAASSSPAVFTLTNEPSAAVTITGLITSSPQAATVNSDFTNPLVVTVADAFGNPVPNVAVVFTLPGEGPTAQLDSTTVMTDAQGRVSIIATASTLVGSYVITAMTDGVTSPVSFALTNLAGSPTTISVVSGGAQTTPAMTVFGEPIVVEVLDVHGNPVPGVTISLNLPTEGASATRQALPIVTDEDGIAIITLTANAVPGSYLVGIAADGAATPTSVNLSNEVLETTTALAVDEPFRLLGGTFEFTARVTSAVGTPSGSVRFMAAEEELGEVELDDNGVAEFTLDALVAGELTVTAIYVPDPPYVTSTGEPVTVTVLESTASGGAVCATTPGTNGRGLNVASFAMLALALTLIRRRARPPVVHRIIATLVLLSTLAGVSCASNTNSQPRDAGGKDAQMDSGLPDLGSVDGGADAFLADCLADLPARVDTRVHRFHSTDGRFHVALASAAPADYCVGGGNCICAGSICGGYEMLRFGVVDNGQGLCLREPSALRYRGGQHSWGEIATATGDAMRYVVQMMWSFDTQSYTDRLELRDPVTDALLGAPFPLVSDDCYSVPAGILGSCCERCQSRERSDD